MSLYHYVFKLVLCVGVLLITIESPLLAGIEERLAGVILLSVHVDGKDIKYEPFSEEIKLNLPAGI